MRCPKCQYIGFDSVDRCRNCGYEFSLAVDEPPLDVTIARDEPGPGRMHDLALTAFNTPLTPADPLDTPVSSSSGASSGRRSSAGSDLPLFTDWVADDQAPLVTPPTVPRPPLAVRRSSPARHRAPLPPAERSLDLGPGRAPIVGDGDDSAADGRADAAGVMRRLAAGILDLAVLGAIAVAVVSLTLRVAELQVAEWQMLPLPPLAAFLLLICGGYFVLFTAAGGQTIGKMVAGIRVVAERGDDRDSRSVAFGTAIVRAAACFCSVALLGAGFLPVLVSRDRRAFHDRIADTRVVTA